MQDAGEGKAWEAVRPTPDLLAEWTSIDALLPEADWFWLSLQRFCVPECESGWRDEDPGDPRELAAALRLAAHEIRAVPASCVTADLFNDILIPESYAGLLEDLATKAEPPRSPQVP